MVASAYGAVSPKGDETTDSEMFNVYILKSLQREWYYVGHTSDLQVRIEYHNAGRVRSTKPYRPFKLVHKEDFQTKSDAFKREQQIKKYRHGEAFKRLIGI